MFNGKTVLITGGSSGIGLATAHRFQSEGARVAITGTDENKLAQARTELDENVLVIQSDVRSVVDLKEMAKIIEREFGKLDILFANAGVAYATPLATTDEESFDRLMDINVKAISFLYYETNGDTTKIADLSFSIGWFVLSSGLFLLLLPTLLRKGFTLSISLVIAFAALILMDTLLVFVMKRFT